MDKKSIERLPLLVLLLLLLLLFITGCSMQPCCYDPTKDQEIRFPSGHASGLGDLRIYSFDPNTILTELDQSDGTIFQPLSDYQAPVFPSGTFPWRQQDYLKIANALNKFVTQDSLEGWSVYNLHSFRDCSDNPVGLDNFLITYFKIDGDQYIARGIEVWSLSKDAAIGGDMHFPRPFPIGWTDWHSLPDLKGLKVTADEALQIAEAQGGKTFRGTVNNECSVFVSLGDRWYVTYSPDGSGSSFQVSIDLYSGEYRITSDK
jgi:hypothetical protein